MLSECMLACAGVITRLGSVTSGTTVSSHHEEEKGRGITVHANLLHCEWLDKKLNILDTPGYLDFLHEAMASLRAADMAVVVVHANSGVQVGTEQTWKWATEDGIPKVIVVNQMDREEIDFEKLLASLRAKFGERVFPLSLPVNVGPGFSQILDVPRSEIITYATDGSGKFTEAPAAGAWVEKVKQLHSQLIEYIAESDDTLLEKFFSQGSLSEEELRKGLHSAVQKQSFIPLFVTSSSTNVGVARLLDFIAKYGSSPVDRAKVPATDSNGKEIEISLTDPDPAVLVFKTVNEVQFGDLSLFRVYSGAVKFGTELFNTTKKINEKIGQIFVINGKTRTPVDHLNAGDIGAVVKLKDTHTGHTLSGGKNPVTLQKITFPKPEIHAALKLNSKGEEDKIGEGMAALHHEDPAFAHHVDSELHQTVISAQGELHLQVLAERLKRRFKVGIELIEPKIRFRETIKGKAESKYRHKKQTGGSGQFAEVWMRIEPKQRDTGVEFTQSLVGQNVDRVFVPSVESGVMNACNDGIVAGYRVVDVKIDFYDGKMHPVDSKDIAFQIAGFFAFREAFAAARPCLLEPIHNVELHVPDDCMGKVMGDLSSRRGKIMGMDADGEMQVIKAQVPAMELYKYATTVRSLTGGRGLHHDEFSHYEEMPRELEQKVIAASKAKKEEAHKAS